MFSIRKYYRALIVYFYFMYYNLLNMFISTYIIKRFLHNTKKNQRNKKI